MKVKIQNRSVYHKFAEVEIEVDKDDLEHFILDRKGMDILDYLQYNCHLYDEQIDKAMSEAEYVHGNGSYDYRGMDDTLSTSEWRFECEELNTGGHL